MPETPYDEWFDRESSIARAQPVEPLQLVYDMDICGYLLNGMPFTGYYLGRDTDGAIRSLTQLTAGIEQGVSVGWYPGGQIEYYNQTARSVLHGLAVVWNEEGAILHKHVYDRGILVSDQNARA